MDSRLPSDIEGLDPSVRKQAEAAAQRAGLSLEQWVNSQLDGRPVQADPAPAAAEKSPAFSDIHHRLDSITRQIEQISQPAPGAPGVARQLNDAISRLDARLSQIRNSAPAAQGQMHARQRQADMVERAAAQVYAASPPLSPTLDAAIAEISARQSELDSRPAHGFAKRHAPASSGPDFSSLERQLFQITSQIDALRRPDGIEQSIASFRTELAEIRQVITEALPRRALETLEGEIHALSARIEDSRQSGSDGQALEAIERALNEIRTSLQTLKPAEQLAGFDEAIRNLGGKVDMIVRASDNPDGLNHLEDAISALRGIVANVASNDVLTQLGGDIRALSQRIDQIVRPEHDTGALASLEQRIDALTSSIESRPQPIASDASLHLEGALRALSERIDNIPAGHDNASALAHLEQRVSYLLERLELATDHRAGNLERVEDSLQQILGHLEQQRSSFTEMSQRMRPTGAPSAAQMDPEVVDALRRELSDMHFTRSEADRHTHDALEVVHNTLSHVVDRIAAIEDDLRAARDVHATPAPQAPAYHPAPDIAPAFRPELPNPALKQVHAQMHPDALSTAPSIVPAPAPEPIRHERSISDILIDTRPSFEPVPQTEPGRAKSRPVINPDLPPDHPLEPGSTLNSTSAPSDRIATPSERIAASESALEDIRQPTPEQRNAASFIAAARRAAQAAAAASPAPNAGPATPPKSRRPAIRMPANISSRIRSLLVGASVVVIVLGGYKFTMSMLERDAAAPVATNDASSAALPLAAPKADSKTADPAAVAPASPAAAPQPSLTSPTPIERQSMNAPAAAPAANAANPAPASSGGTTTASADTTASVTAPPAAATAPVAVAVAGPADNLPPGIGGAALREAAAKGDPTAAYEVAQRYAEGRGVATNYDEAAHWYDRAAQAGIIPAVFRLGTLYEKGLGVAKNLDTARRYYMEAADRGNAKAMHNLAVLDADGGAKGPDYKSAAAWFRKAAEHGVSDSQFNLGILYARGIGVEQNLAESYKWFSLAAAHGDADSGRKRDEVAKRLDPQSLAAAKLAVQTFTAERQPDDAVNVATPRGGWDSPTAKAASAKSTRPTRTASARSANRSAQH